MPRVQMPGEHTPTTWIDDDDVFWLKCQCGYMERLADDHSNEDFYAARKAHQEAMSS